MRLERFQLVYFFFPAKLETVSQVLADLPAIHAISNTFTGGDNCWANSPDAADPPTLA
jgi:hypothetical protein